MNMTTPEEPTSSVASPRALMEANFREKLRSLNVSPDQIGTFIQIFCPAIAELSLTVEVVEELGRLLTPDDLRTIIEERGIEDTARLLASVATNAVETGEEIQEIQEQVTAKLKGSMGMTPAHIEKLVNNMVTIAMQHDHPIQESFAQFLNRDTALMRKRIAIIGADQFILNTLSELQKRVSRPPDQAPESRIIVL